jgi:hypothetical protein
VKIRSKKSLLTVVLQQRHGCIPMTGMVYPCFECCVAKSRRCSITSRFEESTGAMQKMYRSTKLSETSSRSHAMAFISSMAHVK